jgi:hypothetical protein
MGGGYLGHGQTRQPAPQYNPASRLGRLGRWSLVFQQYTEDQTVRYQQKQNDRQ